MIDNFDRLLKHLIPESLASQLIDAYRSARLKDSTQSMRDVVEERFEEVRKNIDGTED